MIPYFRKIRYKLAQDNQFLKYTRYAIGEIVLVVVGILIALQVNNWNESQRDRKFEMQMLQEVSNSLRSDKAYLEMIQRRNQRKEDGIQVMLQMIESGLDYPDSVLLKTYNEVTLRLSFAYNKGGYESIKSVGLDKISDERVRAGLIGAHSSGPRCSIRSDRPLPAGIIGSTFCVCSISNQTSAGPSWAWAPRMASSTCSGELALKVGMP